MLDMYRAGSPFAQIRDRFRQAYPREREIFSIAALRSMFFKILRMAVRRLSQEVYKSGRNDLPELARLEDQLVKNIINCSECFEIRRLLVEVYVSEMCGRVLLTQLIGLINQYAEQGGGVKKSDALSMQLAADS
jgi:signal transduction histidine kinase